jgi:acyl carrier protein
MKLSGAVAMAQRFRSAVREFIAENFLFRADADISDGQSLLEGGVIDSTGVLELIAFLEASYGISIADEEIVPENLDSIDNMSSYLARKLPVAA